MPTLFSRQFSVFFGHYERIVPRHNAKWIGHILRRNCLITHIVKGNIERGIEVTGKQGRRRKNRVDRKETKGSWKLKAEAREIVVCVELALEEAVDLS